MLHERGGPRMAKGRLQRIGRARGGDGAAPRRLAGGLKGSPMCLHRSAACGWHHNGTMQQ